MSWFTRKPDFVIGGSNPYMLRWYIIPRNRFFNIYLHKILRDDDDRALHDHPWRSLSIILAGSYREVRENSDREYRSWSIIYRGAEYAHRLIVVDGPVWTLFFTGRKVRNWGFHCPRGWMPWQQFVDHTDTGNVGKGCDA